jgi:hypothetical protein
MKEFLLPLVASVDISDNRIGPTILAHPTQYLSIIKEHLFLKILNIFTNQLFTD